MERLKGLGGFPEELGIDLSKPEGRFQWFLASLLFAKRISFEIAMRTIKVFQAKGLTTPDAVRKAGWSRLVEALDEGGYVRYDFSTASIILEALKLLRDRYGDDVDRIHEEALSPEDLEARLREFKGYGPVAVNIFLRELRGLWTKAKPKPPRLALHVGRRLGLNKAEIEELEPCLVKLALKYCKRMRCDDCPVKNYCKGIEL